MKEYSVALVGNPNSGKTSIFNRLTGANQSVGNWPGVTVERKSGAARKHPEILIQDLPGIYSLSPYTPEEVISRDYLLKKQPQVIMNVVDGMNLERSLYLTTQLLEMGLRVVVGMNMMDLVKKNEVAINLEKLSYGLGARVISVSALKNQGMDNYLQAAISEAKSPEYLCQFPTYDDKLEAAISQISEVLKASVPQQQLRYFSIKLFERDELVKKQLPLSQKQITDINEIIAITEKLFQDRSDAILVNARYEFIQSLMALCTTNKGDHRLSVSDKIDHVVTNRYLAIPIFVLVMWLIYYLSIQTVGALGTDWVNDRLFGEIVPNFASSLLIHWHVAQWLQDLILNGIIAGVGAVLGFVPQILVLFFCLSILEDCGYMARIAFVLDRLFRKFGLSGKSFIPMLIATGCGVPGVMASRTIENEKDRRLTVMVTTFMPCSAKLPIIALISGAFFPKSSWVAPSAYFVGMSAIVLSGIALKKTKLFSGDPSPFIMELPTYHLPQLKNILKTTFDRGASFVKRAGTIIFVACITIWFLSSYNFHLQEVAEDQSILAAVGHVLAPIFAPLGWGSWKGAVATISGLIAKENVIGTFGVLYGHANEISESGNEVWPLLRQDFTPVAGYSFLLFNLLCAPCFAAIGAIYREMASKKWTLLAVGYQCGLAYVVSFIVYQLGHVIVESGPVTLSTYIAGIVFFLLLGFLMKKPSQNNGNEMVLVREGN